MRRASCQTLGLAVLALAATGSASAALAQTSAPPPAPARYLNWAGRGDVAMPVVAEASGQPGAAQRRPNRVIPHGGAWQAPAVPTVSADTPRRTLTPANAWMHPPAPVPVAMAAPPPPQPSPASRTVPDFLPDQGGRAQPVPAEVAFASPPPAPMPPTVDDPMAPRRDAPIFHMQQTPPPAPAQAQPAAPQGQAEAAPAPREPRRVAMVTANPNDRPAEQGARYYSVHRQAGREPDALTLPQPTYVDALAITTPVTIASQDLAQPDQAPTLIRDAQGRVRAQPAAPEGDYQ